MNNDLQSQYKQMNILKVLGAKVDQKYMKRAQFISNNLISGLQKELDMNDLEINQQIKQFKIKTKQKPQGNSNQKRQKSRRKLTDIDQNQYETIKQNYQSQKRYFKSEMTPQQIQKIKKIKYLQKKYELQLQNKTKLYEENLKKFQQQQKELLQKQKKQKHEERLKQVNKKIQQIRNRQQQRTKKMEDQKKRLIQIKKQKHLHQKLNEIQKQQQLKQLKKKQQLIQMIKQKHNVNFDDIKEHERKYEQILKKEKQLRQRKKGQLQRVNSKKHYESKFLKQTLERQERLKQQQQQKKNELKQILKKKQQYGEYVRNKILPSIVIKQQPQDQKNKTQIVRSVSVFQLKKMGNQYMKKAHETLANMKNSIVSRPAIQKIQQPFKYKDYLKDLKASRKILLTGNERQGKYLQEIDNLMKKQNLSQQQKYSKVKKIAQKIEQDKQKGKSSQKLIDSIHAKINLLKVIDYNNN